MKNLSFAIIGGGPAGFYTAKLLSKLPSHPQIHIYQKQLCPFGLLRYGVAPDHVSIKKSEIVLSQITANQNFAYVGNQNIDFKKLNRLKQKYSGVIFAYGASGDTAPSIQSPAQITKQPQNMIKTAREIVYWYNNHPDFQNYKLNLSNIKTVSIIGNGNVAIDIGRIFLRKPSQLAQTQISLNALQSLKDSSIKNVNIIARRGIVQSAFALKQVRQLTKCNIKIYAIQEQLQSSLNDSSYQQCTALGNNFSNVIRLNKRKLDFMKEHCQIIKMQQLSKVLENDQKKIIFRYLLNPKKINNKKIEFSRTFLHGEPFKQASKDTDQIVEIEHDMLVFSTGFQVSDIQGHQMKNNKLPNSNGCILKSQDKVDIGLYASGWCKTGPHGVLDQTLLSCEQTFNNIRIHYQKEVINQKPRVELQDIFEKGRNVSFDQYKKVLQMQLMNGNKDKFVKKKLLKKQLIDFYGARQQ